jgi:hypothetical protein
MIPFLIMIVFHQQERTETTAVPGDVLETALLNAV